MDLNRLRELLDSFPSTTLAVVGDYFLDKYFVIDPNLGEASLETGLEAHQVVEVRRSPGAAGTVSSNLRALGVQVVALGAVGDDGDGLELERGLWETGVDASQIIRKPGFLTPAYVKPVVRGKDDTERELNRIDIKNRLPLPVVVEAEVISRVRAVLPFVQGVVVVDQVEEHGCGVITDRVRAALTTLAQEHPDKMFAAESRARIGLFHKMILKPNWSEARRAVEKRPGEPADIPGCLQALHRSAEAPVFMTHGGEGILLCDESGVTQIQTLKVNGPIDIVGAGDSVMAGIAGSLCVGASRSEAALIGNLAASVTIRQLGKTGTATPEQVLEAFAEYLAQSLSRSAQSSSVQSSNEVSALPLP